MADDEVRALLRQVLEFLPTLATKADVDRVNAKVDAVAADVAVLRTDVAVLKVGQAQILDHLDVAELKGRVEEQSRAIAQLISTRVAAVPSR